MFIAKVVFCILLVLPLLYLAFLLFSRLVDAILEKD